MPDTVDEPQVPKKDDGYIQCEIHGESDALDFTLREVLLHRYCFLCYSAIPIGLGMKDYLVALPTEEA